MTKLVIRSATKIVIAILLCVLLSSILVLFMPTIGNDIAMEQLENDDFGFVAMESWNRVQNGVGLVQAAIGIICTGSVTFDVYKFSKEIKKENN